MLQTFNQNIRNFRKFRGLTQEELANRLGKTKNVVSNWERGDNAPDVDNIEMICRVLSVTPNQLFGWEPCVEYEKYMERIKQREIKLMELEEDKNKLQYQIDKIMEEIRIEKSRLKEGD